MGRTAFEDKLDKHAKTSPSAYMLFCHEKRMAVNDLEHEYSIECLIT